MSKGLGFFDEEDARAWWKYIEEHLKEKKVLKKTFTVYVDIISNCPICNL